MSLTSRETDVDALVRGLKESRPTLSGFGGTPRELAARYAQWQRDAVSIANAQILLYPRFDRSQFLRDIGYEDQPPTTAKPTKPDTVTCECGYPRAVGFACTSCNRYDQLPKWSPQ